ncbi:sialate O-acetylesterase [Polaribacter sp.]|uniref:sialate O-acetylesterase n=1 Tax=Polaribacter sp. TaxID=1920175 RepID=UPI003F6C5951
MALLNKLILNLIIVISSISCTAQKQKGKHLFILSGQSNMELLRPKESFTPKLNKKFGKRNVIVVQFAKGSQSIRKWYKDWVPAVENESKAEPYLYDSLMKKVKKAIRNKDIATVTFVWMQGERDARKSRRAVYRKSLLGLHKQLSDELGRTDVNFVIGRLSDFGLIKKGWPDWMQIRNIQVEVAESNPRFAWINTDDLNTGVNRKGENIKDGIHMTAEGYVIMGERFADKAIKLIEDNK